MRTRSRTIRVASGLMLLTLLVGCRSSYSPYGQQGYYGQGQGYGQPTYMAPGGYQQPGGTFVAPGSASPGPALQVAPSGGAFVPSNSPHATVIPGGDAPAFDPATPVTPRPGDKLVPEYQDPGAFDSAPMGDSFESQPRFEDDAGFDEPKFDDKGFDGGFDDDAFKDDMSARPAYDDPRVELRGIEPVGDGQFEQPIPFQPAPGRLEETSVRTTRPNPYDHDAEGFTWLRGTIDFDETTRSWNVIYSLRPGAGDKFGGSLELAGPPELFQSLQTGDVVLVEGRVDRADTDALGKPRYRVDQIAGLVPSN